MLAGSTLPSCHHHLHPQEWLINLADLAGGVGGAGELMHACVLQTDPTWPCLLCADVCRVRGCGWCLPACLWSLSLCLSGYKSSTVVGGAGSASWVSLELEVPDISVVPCVATPCCRPSCLVGCSVIRSCPHCTRPCCLLPHAPCLHCWHEGSVCWLCAAGCNWPMHDATCEEGTGQHAQHLCTGNKLMSYSAVSPEPASCMFPVVQTYM